MPKKTAQEDQLPMEQPVKAATNTYPLGTKKYLVTKMLLTGEEEIGKISSELGVKMSTIYNTKAELRKLGYLPKGDVSRKKKEIPPPAVSFSPPPPASTPQKSPPVSLPVISPGEVHREQPPPGSNSVNSPSETSKQSISPSEVTTPPSDTVSHSREDIGGDEELTGEVEAPPVKTPVRKAANSRL